MSGERRDDIAALREVLAFRSVHNVIGGKRKVRADAALARVEAEIARLTESRDRWKAAKEAEGRDVSYLMDQIDRLTDGLQQIADQQPKTLHWLRANGIIFDGPLGTDPGNWENVAFSIYSDLCEVDAIARSLLADTGGKDSE